MALTEYTIKITNGNSDPTFVGTKQLTLADLAVISPTGITTPQTPYVEWVSDTTSQLDGSIQIPAWKRSGTQYFVLPASSVVEFKTDIADEAIFYQGLTDKFANVKVEITTAAITTYTVSLAITGVTVGGTDVAPTATSVPADGLTEISLTYTSGNTDVATIVENKVRGVKAGTAVITGTGTAKLNGETINVGAKATVTVSAS